MLKTIFELLISTWDVVEYSLINWMILGLIGPIVFIASFKIVGGIAFELNYNSFLMSIFHWGIRFVLYVFIVHIIKFVIWIVTIPLSIFKSEHPRFDAAIIVLVIIFTAAIVVKIKSKFNTKIFWK